jgi:hypothetical protein
MFTEFANQVNQSIIELLNVVHTALPGKVLSFDKAKCEAVVQPYGKFKKPDGSMMDYPKINEVPVLFPQGSGQEAIIVWPVKPGDECLVIISEQELGIWRKGGEEPNTDLRYDLSSAVAIPGLFARPSAVVGEAYDNDALIVHNGGEQIWLKRGEVRIRATSFVVEASANIKMTAPRIDLN